MMMMISVRMLMTSVMISVRMMMIVMRDYISVDSMIPDFLIKTFSHKLVQI